MDFADGWYSLYFAVARGAARGREGGGQMTEFLLDGRAIDWIIALVAVEAVALTGLRLIMRRGPASVSFVANLLSGGFLLVALRNALTGASSTILGFCLSAALAAHLVDLLARWQSADGAGRRGRTFC
jgi:hypothetical protein